MKNHLSRREALLTGLALPLFPAITTSKTSTSAQTDPEKKKRNVLLIVGDDHGRDLGCYGNSKVHTPNLDRLASEGIRFTNAFCTTASCSPSRSVILSGLHNHTNGMYGLQHSYHNFACHTWVQGLPKLLSQNDYRTGLFGKFHLQPQSVFPFDDYRAGKKRNHALLAQYARDFLESTRDQPFFMEVAYSDPHRYEKDFGNDLIYEGLPKYSISLEEVEVPPYLPDTPEVRQDLVDYYQVVARLDHGIGLLLEELRRSGRYDDTLIIYISDNGIPFPGAKTTLYDSGVRLPLIVRSPLHDRAGKENSALVSFTDLLPTILQWTGTEPPKYELYELHGRSFLPILDQTNPEGWDEVYFSHQFHEVTMYYPCRGVRTRRYKYIHNLMPELIFPVAGDLGQSLSWKSIMKSGEDKMGVRSRDRFLHRPAEELFDLEQDPQESRNLADDSTYQSVLLELRQKTVAFQKKTKDPWYENESTYRPDHI